MYEGWNDQARRVMRWAEAGARQLDHDYLGTEHVLDAMVCGDAGEVTGMLRARGVEPGAVRVAVETFRGACPATPLGSHLPLTPQAHKALSAAAAYREEFADDELEPQHLLLGLLASEDSTACCVLRHLGVDPHELEQAIRQVFAPSAALPNLVELFGPPADDPFGAPVATVGRNAPCPCGSGRKYKNCCLRTLAADPFADPFAEPFAEPFADPFAEPTPPAPAPEEPDLPALRDLDAHRTQLETELGLARTQGDEGTVLRLQSDLQTLAQRRRDVVAWWRAHGGAVALGGPFFGAVARAYVVTNSSEHGTET